MFLLDVDNTLLDNDRVERDLRRHLEEGSGAEAAARYWETLDQLRVELGYADYLGALQRYRVEYPRDAHLLAMSRYLLDYPFADRIYPGAFDVVEQFRAWGPTVILTDGDVVFQLRKVDRSGLWDAVDGNVLIYIHKEEMLADVEERYPAQYYVMVDDKLRILAAMKEVWRDRLTTVYPRQGKYALDQQVLATYPAADINVDRIDELTEYDIDSFIQLNAEQLPEVDSSAAASNRTAVPARGSSPPS